MLLTMNGTVRSERDANKRAGAVRAGGIGASEAHPGVGRLKAGSLLPFRTDAYALR